MEAARIEARRAAIEARERAAVVAAAREEAMLTEGELRLRLAQSMAHADAEIRRFARGAERILAQASQNAERLDRELASRRAEGTLV